MNRTSRRMKRIAQRASGMTARRPEMRMNTLSPHCNALRLTPFLALPSLLFSSSFLRASCTLFFFFLFLSTIRLLARVPFIIISTPFSLPLSLSSPFLLSSYSPPSFVPLSLLLLHPIVIIPSPLFPSFIESLLRTHAFPPS